MKNKSPWDRLWRGSFRKRQHRQGWRQLAEVFQGGWRIHWSWRSVEATSHSRTLPKVRRQVV